LDTATIAGLSTHVEGSAHVPGTPSIVLLHGYAMRADELCPLCAVARGEGAFPLSRGTRRAAAGTEGRAESTRAYWDVDGPRRAATLAQAPAICPRNIRKGFGLRARGWAAF
jgi:hypothetical protein